MWKLEFEITEHDYDGHGRIIHTFTKKTVLYLPASALIYNQPLPATESAQQYIAEEAARNGRIVEQLCVLAVRLHHDLFSDSTTNQDSTAEFYLHAFVLDSEERMVGIAHLYDRAKKTYHFTPIGLQNYLPKLSSMYVEAYHNMKITQLGDDGQHEILAANEQPTDNELKQWFSKLSSSTHLLCPSEHVKHFKGAVKHNFIVALYNAAIDYYKTILQLLARNDHVAFLEKIRSFNYKFKGIARIQENLGMTSFSDALLHLQDYTLRHKNNDRSLEFFIDELLKRCAQHAEWLNDGGRAYSLCLQHLNEMQTTLEVPETLFDLSIAENLPEMVRKVVFTGYKDAFATPFQFIGVIDERSRFAFTDFAIEASNALDTDKVIHEAIVVAKDKSDEEKTVDVDELEKMIDAIPEVMPLKTTLTYRQKLTRYLASDAFKRIIIGIGIGAGLGLLAAMFVTITLFSGGTFIPVVAAAAALATIGGAAGAIGTMVAGVLLTSFIGGLIGFLMNKKMQKSDRQMPVLESKHPAPHKPGIGSSALVSSRMATNQIIPLQIEVKTAPPIPQRLTGNNIDELLNFLDEDEKEPEPITFIDDYIGDQTHHAPSK